MGMMSPDNALYQLLVQNLSGMALLVFDRDLRYTAAEGPALPLAGFVPQTLIGKTLQDTVSAEAYVRQRPLYQAALEGQSGLFEGSYGDYVYQARVVPVRDAAGQIVAGMVMI